MPSESNKSSFECRTHTHGRPCRSRPARPCVAGFDFAGVNYYMPPTAETKICTGPSEPTPHVSHLPARPVCANGASGGAVRHQDRRRPCAAPQRRPSRNNHRGPAAGRTLDCQRRPPLGARAGCCMAGCRSTSTPLALPNIRKTHCHAARKVRQPPTPA
jgi:hypothetical protein